MTSTRYVQLLNRLRVKHLQVLLAIGELGSIHKAALQLNLSQPGASKLLREAENAFGVTLFVRSAKGITPTATGASLLARARIVLRDLELMHDEASPADENVRGRVSVGAYMVATPLLLPLTIIRLRASHPQVLVSVEEGTNVALLPALMRGELDCIIGRDTEELPQDVKRIVLYEEPVCVVCAPHHELLRVSAPDLAMLSAYEWILPPKQHPLRSRLEAHFTVTGLRKPTLMLESVSTLTNLSILQRTTALAMMPAHAAKYLASLGVIAMLPITFPTSSAPVAVLVHRQHEKPARDAFISAVVAVAESMDSRLDRAARIA